MARATTGVIGLALGMLLILCSGCSTQGSKAPWHRINLSHEFTAGDLTRRFPTNDAHRYQWNDYLRQEETLFAELRQQLALHNTPDGYRYAANSPLNPLLHSPNWNRSFILKPKKIRAGILMLHGLTDSPYSVRSLAQTLQQQGFLVIAPRLPGHGTIPGGIQDAQWRDWVAVVRLAAEELKRQLGDNPHFYILGYSNGGALAVDYTLDALTDENLPKPEKLVLLSPMIGITRWAGLTKPLELIGHLPLLSSQRWLHTAPEYNPFKYNSFPVNAAWQTHRFSLHLKLKIRLMAKTGSLEYMPPVLSFQSIMDSTVITRALVNDLYRHLPANQSELTMFDINRHPSFEPLIQASAKRAMDALFPDSTSAYTLVKISNRDAHNMQVNEWRRPAGSATVVSRPLNLAFPPGVFSLSHVALPFPMDDPVYGLTPRQDEFYGIRLGNLHLLGETGTLIIAPETNLRLNANPFYPYMERRILEWLQ